MPSKYYYALNFTRTLSQAMFIPSICLDQIVYCTCYSDSSWICFKISYISFMQNYIKAVAWRKFFKLPEFLFFINMLFNNTKLTLNIWHKYVQTKFTSAHKNNNYSNSSLIRMHKVIVLLISTICIVNVFKSSDQTHLCVKPLEASWRTLFNTK